MMNSTSQLQESPSFPAILRGSPSFSIPADISSLSPNDDTIDVHALLVEASRRMKEKQNSEITRTESNSQPFINFPKLDPGPLPQPYLEVKKGIAVLNRQKPSQQQSDQAAAEADVTSTKGAFLRVEDPVKAKNGMKQKSKTAGADWFHLPRTELTPEVKRDLQIIKLRNVLDPHKHFKKDNSKEFPKYFQVGTVVEGATEFHSARINRKDRKRNIVDELLSSKESKARFKKKYNEIQGRKRSGKKEHYKKLQARRRGQASS